MDKARISITSVGLAVLLAACGSGGNPSGGSGGNPSGGSGGNPSGGSGGNPNGGSGGDPSGGSGGSAGDGSGGSAGDGAGGTAGGGTTTTSTGKGGASGGNTTTPGQTGGAQSTGGTTTSPGTGGSTVAASTLVTSAAGAYWKSGTWTEATSGTADVTVNDTSPQQKWEGFGGCFNEMGWNKLSTPALQTEAINLLFGSSEGANFSLGRIPIGASDYAMDRYTLDDTGTDVTPDGSESNRPAADTALSKFSLDRDGQKLIPYIKAALAVKPDIRFWASPWTPPVWMKTGYKKNASSPPGGNAKKPSYFDGGSMKSDAATLTAYAQYYTKFVQGYKDQGIKIDIVSPQNEPGYDTNYPSCLWDKATYTTWIGKYLGPAMNTLGVKVMLGTLSNSDSGKDIDSAQAAVADSTAKAFLTVVGAQWGVLDKVNSGTSFGGLPVWASEHKCGNYPWNPGGGIPNYVSSAAPNDQAYGVESWGYIRDAINKGKVTAYNAWNMVLDNVGKGIDTSRDWAQDALLTVSGGAITKTPAYYVFRHCSQFVTPGATVVGTSGSSDAIAFKNTDGSLVAVVYSKSAKSNYLVAIGGKKLQFSMPADGWATIKYKP
jgi:glucosylceramidase